jgi:hypothetical protein
MDLNTNAFRIVATLTGEKTKKPRSVSARDSGRRGGPARAKALSPERRKEIAVKASETRWKSRETSKKP